MANQNRFIPYCNQNEAGFVHATTVGWDDSWKDAISSGCTAAPPGSSVTQQWPMSQIHAPTPTRANAACGRRAHRPAPRVPEVGTGVQTREHRAVQSSTLSSTQNGGAGDYYLHPLVGLAHRTSGLKSETGLCRLGSTAGSLGGTTLGPEAGEPGRAGALVQQLAATDRSGSLGHWAQQQESGGRFGQTASYNALRSSRPL